jgi:membrane-associated protease RseP (regulator of RpoE activity)
MWKGACAGIAAIALLATGVQAAGPAAEAGDYWLGVACFPVPDVLQSQLGLGEHEGLLIRQVVPESPAAKAGIRPDDVLLKAAGKSLASPEDLIKVVSAGKDQKVALELIRAGKKMTLDVQPEKRPAHMRGKPEGRWGGEGDWQALEGWLDHMLPNEGAPLQFHIVRPGAILPLGSPLYPDLPDNVTVVITKHGQEPARIAVHEGDKKWEVTEKELDKLPKDVRPYVDQMLGSAWRGPMAGKAAAGFGASWTAAPAPGQGMIRSDTRLQKRLDEMSRQMEEMQKGLEQLRQKNGPPGKPHPEKAKDQPTLRSDQT